MSNETTVLALRFRGPMQSWGFNSQFNRRDTSLFPTKSAIAGICCAAMGFERGSADELVFLKKFSTLRLHCLAIPVFKNSKELSVKRIQDYHTVQNTRDAKGSIKSDAVLTYRQYLNDAAFIALLTGDNVLLNEIAFGTPVNHWCLQDPRWGIWLGRKACIPSAPVFAGLFKSIEEAIQQLPECGKMPIERFCRVVEVENFSDGVDTYMDQVETFAAHGKKFVPRRVLLKEAII